MDDQKVFMCTADNRIQYFDIKKLAENKEQLEQSDFKTLQGPLDDDYTTGGLVLWHTTHNIVVGLS